MTPSIQLPEPSNSRSAILGTPSLGSSTDCEIHDSEIVRMCTSKPSIVFVQTNNKSRFLNKIKRFIIPSRQIIKPIWSRIRFRRRRKSRNYQVLSDDDLVDESLVPARHVCTPLAMSLFSRECLKKGRSTDALSNMLKSLSKTSLKTSSTKSVFDNESNIMATNATTPNSNIN